MGNPTTIKQPKAEIGGPGGIMTGVMNTVLGKKTLNNTIQYEA